MASFRAVRTLGDMPLLVPRRRDDDDPSSSSSSDSDSSSSKESTASRNSESSVKCAGRRLSSGTSTAPSLSSDCGKKQVEKISNLKQLRTSKDQQELVKKQLRARFETHPPKLRADDAGGKDAGAVVRPRSPGRRATVGGETLNFLKVRTEGNLPELTPEDLPDSNLVSFSRKGSMHRPSSMKDLPDSNLVSFSRKGSMHRLSILKDGGSQSRSQSRCRGFEGSSRSCTPAREPPSTDHAAVPPRESVSSVLQAKLKQEVARCGTSFRVSITVDDGIEEWPCQESFSARRPGSCRISTSGAPSSGEPCQAWPGRESFRRMRASSRIGAAPSLSALSSSDPCQEPLAGASEVQRPSAVPAPPLKPQAPATGRMRRLGRPVPVRHGWSKVEEKPEESPSRSTTVTPTQEDSSSARHANFDDSCFQETCRVTFADGPGRSEKRGSILEYRPRIRFLNALSSVTGTVFEYAEAVACEVCKAILAAKVFVCFADDIREEVYCMGQGEMASSLKWNEGVVGTTVCNGTVAHFGQTEDPQLQGLLGGQIRSLLCLPVHHMLDQGKHIGAIVAMNKIGQASAQFTEADKKVLQDITRLASDSFYRQRWNALEKASSKGDSEALALISSTKPRRCEKQEQSTAREGAENHANMDLLSQKIVWVDVPVEVRSAKLSKLQCLSFDALDYHPDDLLCFVELVMQHTGCVDRCAIPPGRLRAWASEAKRKYHDNPFHNWFHGFSVFQMCYYQLWISPLRDLFSALDVFGLLIASLCHDLDHPGFTNNYMVDSQSKLALIHNDIAVLENHHASLACELLRRDATAIGGGLDAAAQKALRRVIIKCILDTDMAKHSESCQKLSGAGATEDRQLMLGACIHTADLSAQVLPWKTAQKWEERISMEFTRQARKEVAAGRSPAPFMSFHPDDVKQRGKLQRDFCDFVLFPLWDPYTQQLPALRPCYRNLVKNRSFYEHRWNTGEDPDPKWCK